MPKTSPKAKTAEWAKAAIASDEAELVGGEWVMHARPAQYPLLGTKDVWLVIGGRGSGKTRLGAEWVNALARGFAPFARVRHGLIALVGETMADVRDVMIEGPAGILASSRHDRPRFESSRRRLLWPNGAVAQMFSSEDPESLRGPQFEAAWCDELGKWKHADAVYDMLQFGLRLGARPVQLITTTPKPVPLIKRLLADEAVTVSRMRTDDNAENLAAGFLDAVRRKYGRTRLGRQELDGELIEDREGALWTRALIESCMKPAEGELRRIVVAVDPPAGSGPNSDACGIIAAGIDAAGNAVVLADASVQGAKPHEWARRALALYEALEADCLVAEVNQGGEMVSSVLAAIDPKAVVKRVRARRGKWLRAEPVAALYAAGRVRHTQPMPELEDEMCDFGPDGLSGGRSPDRVDALVWAIGELMLARVGEPRVRDF